jgi:hypothetical protein
MMTLIKNLNIFQKNKEAEYEKCTICLSQKMGRRRILDFSDDDDNDDDDDDDESYISFRVTGRSGPTKVPWRTWLWYITATTGNTLLKVRVYLDEYLARLFRIIGGTREY